MLAQLKGSFEDAFESTPHPGYQNRGTIEHASLTDASLWGNLLEDCPELWFDTQCADVLHVTLIPSC